MADVQKLRTPEGDEFALVDGAVLQLPKEEPDFLETAFEAEELDIPETFKQIIADPTRPIKDVGLGIVSGFRTIPRTGAAALRIFGVKGPLKELNETARHITPDDPGIAFGVGQMLGQQFTAQVLTRGRALPLLVAGAGIQKTADALDEGQPLGNAIAAGASTAFLEYITEKIPQGELSKKGKSYFKKLWKVWGADIVGEIGAFLGEVGVIDPLILNKETPSLVQLGEGALDVGLTAFIAGPIVTAGVQTGVLPSAKPKTGPLAPTTPSIDSRVTQAKDVTPEAKATQTEAEELLSRIKPVELSNIDAEILAEALVPITQRKLVIDKQPPAETMRSLEEQQKFVQEAFEEERPPLYTDESGVVVTSLEAQTNLAKDIAKTDGALRSVPFIEEVPRIDNIDFDAVDNLGKTTDLNEAGFIEPSGSLVDLSGRAEGRPGGSRILGHNSVSIRNSTFFGEEEFKALGNIRMDLSDHTIDILKEPTRAQYQKIAQIAKRLEGEVFIDLDVGLGEVFPFQEGTMSGFYGSTPEAKRIVFKVGTRTSEIISAIREYYKTKPIKFTQEERELSIQEFPELVKQAEKLVKKDDPLRLRGPVEFVIPEKIVQSAQAWEDDKVTKAMTKATDATKAQRKVTAKKVGQMLTKQLFDRQGNVKRELIKTKDPDAKRAKIRLENRAGSTAWSEYEMQVAYDATTRGLNGQERRMFNSVVQGMRSLEIEYFKPDFKFQEGLKGKDYAANMKKIPEATLAKLKPLAEKYWGTIDNKLQELVDAEITTQDSKERLKMKGEFYSPRNVLDYADGEERTFLKGGKKITVPDSGIQKLSDEGSLKLIESDATELLHQVITRINARIFNNNANQALYDLAINNPENGVVQAAPIISATKEGKPEFKKAPLGSQSFSVMVEGQEKQFYMKNDLANEWVTGEASVNKTLATFLNITSGSFILKPMATGLNPGFAFGNLPKDAAHSWLVTGQWSPILPVAAYQMNVDYKDTFKDAIQKKGLYVDLLKNGGGMTLMSQEFKTSKLTGGVRATEDVLGFTSEFSEIWTRLAIVNRARKNGKSMEEAVNIARNMLDFYQGGEAVKALDHGMPYLNAGTQGTRTILQAAKKDPATFTAKMAQLGLMAAAIGSLWRYLYKDFWKDVNIRDKTGFWNIPTPIKFKDTKGVERMVYLKISKDQGQRMFASFFDNLWAAANGESIDWDEIKLASKDFLSATPEDAMPPTLDAWMGMKSNINFWTDERIYKEKFTGPVKPEDEFTRFTPEIYKKIGQTTGTSPVRLEYAMRQVFTNGNMWTAIAGYPLQKILGEVDEETADEVGSDMWIKLSRTPILKRFIGVTNPNNRQKNEIHDAAVEENSRKLRLNRVFDELKGAVKRGEEPVVKMGEFLGSLQEDDLKRVLNREKKHLQLEKANLNFPSYWLKLTGLPTRAKAKVIFQEVMTSSVERKKLLLNDLDSISQSKILGLSSPAVVTELKKLMDKERRSR